MCGVLYLCLSTTSSFASCRQMLLLVPGEHVSCFILTKAIKDSSYHDCDDWECFDVVAEAY